VLSQEDIRRQEYTARINRVIDYIDAHLDETLSLERAAMRINANPKETLTEIALACGFSSPSVFARAFRERLGLSASKWRRRGSTRGISSVS
jgi:AraC family transcriptional regulator